MKPHLHHPRLRRLKGLTPQERPAPLRYPETLQHALILLDKPGDRGAVREISDLILSVS